jgi:hypothetical protein
MMPDPFERMHNRLLSLLGEEAVLRSTPCRVAIEHGVAITGDYGSVVGFRSVATIPADLSPKKGDQLTVGAKAYTLDALDSSDGYTARFILR